MLFAKNCAPGTEQWETFKRKGKTFVQYDYRDEAGVLFSCCKETLEECRKAAVAWQKKQEDHLLGRGGVKACLVLVLASFMLSACGDPNYKEPEPVAVPTKIMIDYVPNAPHIPRPVFPNLSGARIAETEVAP